MPEFFLFSSAVNWMSTLSHHWGFGTEENIWPFSVWKALPELQIKWRMALITIPFWTSIELLDRNYYFQTFSNTLHFFLDLCPALLILNIKDWQECHVSNPELTRAVCQKFWWKSVSHKENIISPRKLSYAYCFISENHI